MPSPSAQIPYRYLTWRMIEFQTDSLKLALRVFPGDLHRAIIFVLIARMACGEWVTGNAIARPTHQRAFSINALAASLSRPFETVRRHVNGMIADGVCIRVDDGIILSPRLQREDDIVGYYRDAANLIIRLGQHVIDGGVPLPRPERVSDDQLGPLVKAALDIGLVALENNEHSHWFELVLHGALIYENGRDIMGTPDLAAIYGNMVLPDDLRRPVTIRVLAGNYGMPYATVRRHVDAMMESGRLLKKQGGYFLNTAWTGRDERIEGSDKSVDYVLRQFRLLAAAGVDVTSRQHALSNTPQ